jgi:hypothetical protein
LVIFIWWNSCEFLGTHALKKVETSWVYVHHTLHLFEHVLSQYFNYELIDFLWPDDVIFILLNMFMMYEPYVWRFLLNWQYNTSMFVGIISGKPSRDFTRPLGSPRGLKGLLHMLNAIVSPTKEDLCFMLWFCFLFFILFC